MPRVDVVNETPIASSGRGRLLEGMFDVPRREVSRVEWHADIPIEDRPWNIGAIVGPSGSGKSCVARALFGDSHERPLAWESACVLDDFDSSISMEDIASACQAVGFNTVPNWLRPYRVLSNGERFRVELARRLLEMPDPVVVDEFTSVVDRQVGKIASHAVQKYVRRSGKRFVAVTCHYDVLDWLRPDWVFDPSSGEFRWGCLQRRPELRCTISPVRYAAWRLFAPFHYLTGDLNRSARCFVLFVDESPAAIAAMLHRPGTGGVMGCSRLVTLPDFQGMGLAFALIDRVAALYKAVGRPVHTYPAHPALIRGFDKSPAWSLRKRPGLFSESLFARRDRGNKTRAGGREGGRPCAVFRYEGPAADRVEADRVFAYWEAA